MQGYTDEIRKYAAATSHIGLLKNPDGTGEVGLSGKEVGKRLAVRFTLKLKQNKVTAIRFQVFGCGFTIAACAVAAELSEGRSVAEIQQYTAEAIAQQLGGLPDERSYCADLANQALQAAIRSTRNAAKPIEVVPNIFSKEAHNSLLSSGHPLYRTLLASPAPTGVEKLDRQMFSGLLSVVTQENEQIETALGLDSDDLSELLSFYFPEFDRTLLKGSLCGTQVSTENYADLLKILLSHVPCDVTGGRNQPSEWLARCLAARTNRPGHLWCAMGFFERPQLTAAIRRHLPTLAAANNKGMRWKRYLSKQVCELSGGTLCKAPNCGDCSDYVLCFAPEDD